MNERKPNDLTVPAAHAQAPDEIDLVDLAVVLVRRWRIMLAVFVATVALGWLAAVLKPVSYQYSAVADIGQRANGALLESPEGVQASISNMIIPAVAAEDTDVRELAANVRVEALKGSGAVVLRVVAPEANAQAIANFFAQIRQELLARQSVAFDRLVKPLQAQAAARESEIEMLNEQIAKLEERLADADGQARIVLIDRIGRLQEARRFARQELVQFQADISRMAPTRMSESPQRSLKAQGTSPALIIVLSIVLGALLAVFAAFIAEFAARVRARLGS
jgi:uncharacterized protein involved in exopolysaccharide biosynthesis